MNESYKELLVKRDKGFKETLIRGACITVTVLLALLMLATANVVIFIMVIAFGALDYFVLQWTDIEFEYLYLDKEISVDKIMAKTRRKKLVTLAVDKIEIMAPEKSHQLDSYRNRQTKV
ncbi:MAG: hypothetical protein K2P39_00295, partial [Lachnospiraceae bacterium]|nr:hypothetical protein [Lachnospiraceae bacterium]